MHELPCRHVVCGRLAVGNGVRAALLAVARRRWPLSLGRAAGAWAGGVRHGLVRELRRTRAGAACPRGERYIVMYLVTIRTRFDEHAVN
jgi:hypothetical protein